MGDAVLYDTDLALGGDLCLRKGHLLGWYGQP